ncbi:MAG: DUF2306 domain-containing protein [Novosphingobium sp.]|uniref:DUF2306 domain-containing protein n=1 Tax=Novosphingobium sp. TaxID=1874826 RepID=UPI0032B73007
MMVNLPTQAERAVPRAGRIAVGAILAVFGGLVATTAWKALTAPWRIDDFPEELAIKAELLPGIFTVHMIAGGLALVLVPLAIALSGRPRWHRPVARLVALDVAVAGITAFPVALIAPVTRGSAWGFTAQGLIWLVLLALGIRAIHQRQIARHRACMLLMAAAASGAVFFRIYLALWAIFAQGRHYELFYAVDAWVAWAVPLTLTALVLKRNGAWSGHPA